MDRKIQYHENRTFLFCLSIYVPFMCKRHQCNWKACFGGVYSIVSPSFNFKYAIVQSQSIKNDIFSLFEVSQKFIHAFCLSNVFFEIRKMELLILIKTLLKSFCHCKVYLQYGMVNQRVVTH